MSRLPRSLVVATLAGLLSGCASAPKDAGFSEVQGTVRERTGVAAEWVRHPDQEQAVKRRTQALLEGQLDVEGAVEVALLNNRRLQATFEELGLARADLLQSRLGHNPVLGIDIRSPERAFELSLVQNLISLLQIRRRHAVAAAGFEAAKLHVTHEVLDLVARVRAACYTLQEGEQVARLRRSVVEAARASAELAIRQREAGNLPDLDVENEQAFLEQAKLQLASSEGEVLSSREHLNRLMGLWGPQTAWTIAPALPDPPSSDPPLQGLESLAVAQRLDLRAAWAELQAAARAVPLARSSANLDISVGVHREREPEGTTTTGPVLDYAVPIFDRGRPAKSRAEALWRRSQDRYAALAVEIRSEIRETWHRLTLARSRVAYYGDVVLPRRARIIQLSQRNYNYMLLGPYHLILAKQNEIDAQIGYLESLKEYWLARAGLQRATGGSLGMDAMSPRPAQRSEPSNPEATLPEPHDEDHGEKP
jgi:cobalt-zinc-cadmium efflux system outer membrane protein